MPRRLASSPSLGASTRSSAAVPSMAKVPPLADRPRTPTSVVVMAFDRISPFHLSVPCIVFGETHVGMPALDFRVCAVQRGTIRTTAGFSIDVRYGLTSLKTADLIIVPSWHDPAERPPDAMLKALIAAQKRGALVVGLCLGAYVLAEAGLLDGRRATTHWAYASHFADRYPTIDVHGEALYVRDGNVLTSAGTAAGIDCCLHIVREYYGAEVANSLARRLVVPPHRQGGQAQFVDQPLPIDGRSTRLSDTLDAVRARLSSAHTIDDVASAALMSRRTFTRQFANLTGTTFGKWLLHERLALAQRLLETRDHSIEAVATLSGFGSPESLRAHFRRAFDVSPSVWRQAFRG